MTRRPKWWSDPFRPDHGELDLLMLWRKEPYQPLDHRHGLVQKVLIDQVRLRELKDADQILRQAEAGNIETWLWLADLFDREGWLHSADRSASCVLVAITHGSGWAAAILLLRLAQIRPLAVERVAWFDAMRGLTSKLPDIKASPLKFLQSFKSDAAVAAALVRSKPGRNRRRRAGIDQPQRPASNDN